MGNIVVFLREFTERVRQEHVVDWDHDIAQSSKLALFRSVKPLGINRPSYLYTITIRKYRAGLAKLRCSAHDLRIEKGRHRGELVADRICKLCLRSEERYVLEDEYHFVMCCPQYENRRELYLPHWVLEPITYEHFLSLLCNEEEETVKSLAS